MGSGEEKPLLLRGAEDAPPGARDAGSATVGGEDAVFFPGCSAAGAADEPGYAEKGSVMSAAAVQHETHAAGCGVLQNSASPGKGRGEKAVERRAALCKKGCFFRKNGGLKVGMACRSCAFMP